MHAARPPGSSTGQASRVHYSGHRPEQTTLYHLFQQHAASFIAHTEASTGAELPRFAKVQHPGAWLSQAALRDRGEFSRKGAFVGRQPSCRAMGADYDEFVAERG